MFAPLFICFAQNTMIHSFLLQKCSRKSVNSSTRWMRSLAPDTTSSLLSCFSLVCCRSTSRPALSITRTLPRLRALLTTASLVLCVLLEISGGDWFNRQTPIAGQSPDLFNSINSGLAATISLEATSLSFVNLHSKKMIGWIKALPDELSSVFD